MESPATSSSSTAGDVVNTDIILIVVVPLILVGILVGISVYLYRREEKKRKLLLQLTRRDRALRRLSVNDVPKGSNIQKKLSSISTEATSEV